MKLVLEIKTGEKTGHKKWIRTGEELVVGRRDDADFVLTDPQVSGLHFAVRLMEQACRLKDLQSTNGTFLNGKQVYEGALKDGDIIRVGETLINVQVLDAVQPPEEELVDEETKSAPKVRKVAETVQQTAMEDAETDEHHFRPFVSEATIASPDPTSDVEPVFHACRFGFDAEALGATIRKLATLSTMYMIFDFAKVARKTPDEVVNPVYLYDWHPEKVRPFMSPVLFEMSPEQGWELIESGWGHDCTVCLFTGQPGQLAASLKQMAGGNPESPIDFASPTKLSELFESGAVPMAGDSVLQADLMEGEQGDGAILFLADGFIDDIGLLELPGQGE